MSLIHLLIADIPLPERFTYPFCYEPHPLCLMAAEEVKREIERILPTEGKMFGVLVVKAEEGLGFFFDAQQPDGHFKQTERAISAKGGDKQMSQELQLWLFHQYRMLNAKGETKDLVDIWQDYHCSPRIRNRYPLPPGGTGDCCAPKLLQYAFSHGLRPVCMAEFWWGPSPKSEIRHHGQFYPACRGKCKPILTWMLQGLDVDPNPEETGASHLTIEVIYQDTTLAVINKPSGLLSVPGRLMVIAKTKEAYVSLQEQFVKRTVKKRYIALVEGIVKEPKGRITLPLIFDPMNRPRQMVDYQRGKSAVTEYEVLDARDGRTLLALYPHTGRTHQLRMHCAHPDGLGCPIVGDELYGHKAERLCLHCDQIEFAHPVTGERMHFNLPNPF